ncbi:MAG TPA: phage tail protein, partial [Gaiellaceae bacterium]|nr:phage tail protein [Gaiellaceae bacterium]
FVVELGGEEVGGFSEVDLPSGEIEVIEYREGSDKSSAARKLPGLAKYGNVALKRGITGRTELFDWWKSVRDGSPARRNVSITLLDEARNPVQRWVLRDAWPAKLDHGRLEGLGNEVAIETLELAHEGFELD